MTAARKKVRSAKKRSHLGFQKATPTQHRETEIEDQVEEPRRPPGIAVRKTVAEARNPRKMIPQKPIEKKIPAIEGGVEVEADTSDLFWMNLVLWELRECTMLRTMYQGYLRNSWGECISLAECDHCSDKHHLNMDYHLCESPCPIVCNQPVDENCANMCFKECACRPGYISAYVPKTAQAAVENALVPTRGTRDVYVAAFPVASKGVTGTAVTNAWAEVACASVVMLLCNGGRWYAFAKTSVPNAARSVLRETKFTCTASPSAHGLAIIRNPADAGGRAMAKGAPASLDML
ncbi:hypothetical protein HPB48_022829 [Haemaphysalis longicornis]|uniref:TIL domain-containing protein n=1 Tax=Haemaphysalis longicornis TaxID=44386 RepID=A0A9J6H1T4_HAELO|nr:hypothetical protein HPB48_022829 [Haemaphysalis longicornis]